MSAKLAKKRLIHDEVSEWIFRSFVDPENSMGVWLVNAGNQRVQLNLNQQEQKSRVQNSRLRTIFGNIADHSAGPATVYPSISVSYQVMNIQGIEGVAQMDGNFNLRTLVENLKTFLLTSQDPQLNTATLREVCRSFANYALEYYMEDPDRMSNLADKMPQLALQAREVMFDFSDGISQQYLRGFPMRAKVIQELNSRLLQSTGTKAVFEAKGTIESSVNLIV
uniref:Coat protein n=1 Tax=Camellia japonica associated betaflexivirus 3 TaxID=2686306 RepID=A0A6B9HCN8_9VIRU|nr:coat protein [Camellia japonica associated betaflexivirus 3]